MDALVDDGLDKFQSRAVKARRWDDVQPLTAASHPLLEKCRSELGDSTHTEGRVIRASGKLRLSEVRYSQWRGGLWTDIDGVRWVVSVGLAKGDHQDREDFYQGLERQCRTPEGMQSLLPTELDKHLLNRETASRLLTDWEMQVQKMVPGLLERAVTDGSSRLSIPHPSRPEVVLTEIELGVEVVDDIENINLSFISQSRPGSRLEQLLELRLLVSIAPPEQDWDLSLGIYSAMEALGHCKKQARDLKEASTNGVLLESRPGRTAHFAHKRHIGDATVKGQAVRALCGTFFVPHTNPDALPKCEKCRQHYERLPG